MSTVVNAESIKQYNARLNNHKTKVERLRVQVEMQEKEVMNQLQKLTEELGVPVTEENVQQLYEQYKADLENQLINGNAILDRIEGKAVAQSAQQAPTMQTAQPVMTNPFAQQQPQPVQGAFGYGQPAQPAINTAPPQSQPSQYAAPVGQTFGQTVAPNPPMGQIGAPVGQPLNPGMPAQSASPFNGFAQNMGNFDTQKGVDMNGFGQVVGV